MEKQQSTRAVHMAGYMGFFMAALFFSALATGCKTQLTLPEGVELDDAATQAAPWAVGAVVAQGGDSYYAQADENTTLERKFWGVTRDGRYVVQDFYAVGPVRFTDPYLVTDARGVTDDEFRPSVLCCVIGPYTVWYRNGHKGMAVTFDDAGRFDGAAVSWHKNGVVSSTGTFTHDLEQGVFERWDERGQLYERTMYVDGNKEGLYEKWHGNGLLQTQGQYVHGRKDGVWRQWHVNGVLAVQETYVNGLRQGQANSWHRSGNLAYEGMYVNNRETGLWLRWDEDGSLSDSQLYGAGQ